MNYILKLILLTLIIFSFSACQETSNTRPYMLNGKKAGVNPNSMAYLTEDKALDRNNRIKMAEIQANSQVAVAKVELNKAVKVAKINSDTTKDVTKQTAVTTLAVTELDKKIKEQQIMANLYIYIATLVAIVIGFLLWYRHKKKSLDFKIKLEENRLNHELELKDKELKEQRIQKILDLAISGQLPAEIQQEVIYSLTRPESKLIESK